MTENSASFQISEDTIWLCQNKNYSLIDCQVYTSHLESLGAEFISRNRYLDYLNAIGGNE